MLKSVFIYSILFCAFIQACRIETKDHERCGCDDLKPGTDATQQDTISLFAPRAFTPNGDGLNDLFMPVYSDKKDLVFMRFEVFNRKRKKIYFSTIDNSTTGWNGTNKQGEQLGTDIYAWTFSGTTITGANVKWNGEVLLYRHCYKNMQLNRCNFGDMIIPGQGFVLPTSEAFCK